MASLENTILGLKQQRHPDFEIIVVHGPCTDETLTILERHRDAIRTAACPIANLSASRNIGIRLACKELVAFIDDDAVPEPDWLDRLSAGFTDPRVAAVGGYIRDTSGVAYQHQTIIANRLGDARSAALPTESPAPGEFLSPTGTNICLRRDCLTEVGGFDETFAYFLEETDVNLRLLERGFSIAFNPDAEVHHYFLENKVRNKTRVPRSLYQAAHSKAYFCWKHGPAEFSASQIRAGIARYRARLRRNLVWFRATRRLTAADAARLRDELDQGLADGERSAREASPGVTPRFLADTVAPSQTPAPALRRPRVCWLSGSPDPAPADADGHLLLELTGLGHEVTGIFPAAGAHTAVRFDGAWRHRVGVGKSPTSARWKRYGAAVLQELERIQPRRCFDIVLCPGELQAGLAPFAARGVKIAVCAVASARDLDARIRATTVLAPA
jgi:hypothetical protein